MDEKIVFLLHFSVLLFATGLYFTYICGVVEPAVAPMRSDRQPATAEKPTPTE
jgi:hypothetical protein